MLVLRVVQSAGERSRRVKEADGFQVSQQEKRSLEGWLQEVSTFWRKADFTHTHGAWNAPTRLHVPFAEFFTVHRRLAVWHKGVVCQTVRGETQLTAIRGYLVVVQLSPNTASASRSERHGTNPCLRKC